MNTENIKDAFNKFIDKKYDESRTIISQEIDKNINNYFKSELDLEKDIFDIEEESNG